MNVATCARVANNKNFILAFLLLIFVYIYIYIYIYILYVQTVFQNILYFGWVFC